MQNKEIIYQQYRQMCESAEEITNKRQTLNNFYLTINSVFLSLVGYFSTGASNFEGVLVGLISIIISSIWFFHIESFKKLNKAKFKIILKLEENLPVKLYGWENELLKKGYYSLTSLEKIMPITFFTIGLILLIYTILLT